MTSPDITPYVDLRVFDRNAQTIFNDARALLETRIPGIVLRENTTEAALLESMALVADELTFAVNRLPGAIIEILLRLYGVERDDGEAATGVATFNAVDSTGHTIPVDTTMRIDVGSGRFVELFTTDAAVINEGSTSVVVPVEARDRGTIGNDIVIGTELVLISRLSFVQTVVISATTAGGREPELPTDYLNRGVQVLRRLVNTLVTPVHFEAAALAFPGVFRAKAIDLYDSTAGSGAPGSHPGHITIAVLDTSGIALTSIAKAELQTTLASQAQANLAIHVTDPTITTVNITTTVQRRPGFDSATVQANVVDVIRGYVSPLSWPWAGILRTNELISLIDSVVGVEYVASVTPAADVTLTGVATLADAGTVDVTVTT